MEKFERLRENFVAYTMIAEKFVQCVVGVNIFKKNCCVKNFSEYISVSDEAMTMLILANNGMCGLKLLDTKLLQILKIYRV